jgi:zinc D-Ala-D-Ala dipeptidase
MPTSDVCSTRSMETDAFISFHRQGVSQMGRCDKTKKVLTVCFVFFVVLCACVSSHALPPGFVYLEDVVPNILVELRYFGNDNFVGRPIDGYLKPSCIITKATAQALKRVQSELNQYGLGLKIYDAYRPQRAVNFFLRWSKDLHDQEMKEQYYPNVKKDSLFEQGYISEKSGHSRGSTVDLTMVSITEPDVGKEIDMGSPFDFFDPKSWMNGPHLSPSARVHRLLLRMIMEKNGFQPYEKEWWHFNLKQEPYPDTYFDFPVE